MYYAQMFSYGTDVNHVGITGILGCLGVVFASANHLYAVHIPPSSAQRELVGAIAFCHMVIGTEGGNPAGTLHLFVNGSNRTGVDSEARHIRTALGGPATRVYRLMTNLGPNSGASNADSACIKVQSAGGLNLSYKHVADNNMVAGGNARRGCYDPLQAGNANFAAAVVPDGPTLAAPWIQMGPATCMIRGIH